MSEPSLAEQFCLKRKKSLKRKSNEADDVEAEDSATLHNDTSDPRVTTSCFDYSVDSFFKAMDMIAQLCGEEVDSYVEPTEIQRLSSSVTFLREWRHFHYEPRSIRFACGFGSPEAKDAINCIKLPQFSSAAVPEEGLLKDAKSHESRDYLLYVGGPVWALDWCPQSDLKPDSSVKCEFLGVAAHPPGASYHKMGSPLTGRGLVQIWCVLNSSKSNEEALPLSGKSKKAHKNKGATEDNSTQIKRPRGRPRKKQIEVAVADINSETHSALTVVTDGDLENVKEGCPPSENSEQDPAKNGIMSDNITQVKKPRGRPKKKSKKNSNEVAVSALNSENQHMEALAIEFPENSAASRFADGISYNCEEYGSQTDSDAINKCSNKSVSACTPISRSNCRDDSFNHDESPLLLTQHEDDANHQPTCTSEVQLGGATCSVPEFFALPRIVLCLAHNGKVAWDLKWRPSDGSDSICKHRMGYLAFLLGNGSLEV